MSSRKLLSTFLLLLMATACRSTITGNEGNLEFSYSSAEDVFNYNKPIAVGARLDLRVEEAGNSNEVSLRNAQSDAPEVLRIPEFGGETVVLEATGEGQALISVEAQLQDGSTVTDSVNMLGRVPELLSLHHTCTPERAARYLVNQDIAIGYDMEMSNGQAVIGYGYHPVDIDPANGLIPNTESKAQEHMYFFTGSQPGPVTLVSQLNNVTLGVDLVNLGDIDGAEVREFVEGSVPRQGTRVYLHLSPLVGGERLCQARVEFTVQSDSPEICSVGVGTDPESEGEDVETSGWFWLEGIEIGACRFTASYPAANGGRGLDVTLEKQVVSGVIPEAGDGSER